MRTLEVSDAVYKEILSRRIGRESFSKTIMRELRPVEKCDIRESWSNCEDSRVMIFRILKRNTGFNRL